MRYALCVMRSMIYVLCSMFYVMRYALCVMRISACYLKSKLFHRIIRRFFVYDNIVRMAFFHAGG
jgi:hypothetical protein